MVYDRVNRQNERYWNSSINAFYCAEIESEFATGVHVVVVANPLIRYTRYTYLPIYTC